MINSVFREYVFSRAFHIHLREGQMETLAHIVKGDAVICRFPDTRHARALMERGLIMRDPVDSGGFAYTATRAGVLVFELFVEAGAQEKLAAERVAQLEETWKRDQEEWDRRFGDPLVKLKEKP